MILILKSNPKLLLVVKISFFKTPYVKTLDKVFIDVKTKTDTNKKKIIIESTRTLRFLLNKLFKKNLTNYILL